MKYYERTGVAWAVPVEVDVLGARLQSYRETRPVIDTLRLCNRFGKGDQAFVTRLPTELLEEVVQHIRWADLESNLKWWSQGLGCCEGSCSTLDHWTGEELLQIHTEDEMNKNCDCESEEQMKNCWTMTNWLEHEWEEVHTIILERFLRKIQEIFAEDTKVLNRVFGLETMINLNPEMCDADPPAYSVVAYIVLPESFSATASSPTFLVLRPDAFKPLTAKQSSQFKLAMRTLQLQPFIHPAQYTTTARPLFENDPRWPRAKTIKRIQALEESEWPKFLLLSGATFY